MTALRRLHAAYRASGADLPFGDPLSAHGLAMEGYFWRISERASGRAAIVLAGINRPHDGTAPWSTLGIALSPGGAISTLAHEQGYADPHRLGAAAGAAFRADAGRVHAEWAGASADFVVAQPRPWPLRPFGGSSIFQSVPGLNQYWHPWLLGGQASGVVTAGDDRWEFTDAQVYGEKNWGKGGFPDSWWWGQAQAFAEQDACVAFAGGQVYAGPIRTTVTGLVVRLPGGRVVRLGNPGLSPVRAQVDDTTWRLRGRGYGWRVDVHGAAPLGDAHVLPVPLPDERRNTAGALEHLAGTLSVTVRRRGRLVWSGESPLAGLEHGGLARAEAELRRRGIPPGATDAPPQVRP